MNLQRVLSLLAPMVFASCSSGGSGGSESASVSRTLSSVSVPVLSGILSDGVAAASIEITLRDPNGQPVPGRVVTITATGSQNFFWPADTARTDGSGSTQILLTTTDAGDKELSVSVDGGAGGGPLTLDDQPLVEFVDPEVPRRRVSVSSADKEAEDFNGQAAISGNGRFVGFQSKAPNLVPGDSNQKEDVFVHDLQTSTTERVSLTPSGGQFTDLSGNPSLSYDGLLVAFQGRLSDDDAVFVRDRPAGLTQPISDAAGLDGRCFDPALSGDGRYVAFVCNDGESQHVYAFDRLSLALELVSKSSTGQPGDDPSYAPSITRGGRFVAFASTADNLVGGDSNDKDDVFVHDRQTGRTIRVSVDAGGDEGDGDSREAAIAADGRWVAFTSKAENLVSDDDNGKDDVFRYDLATGAIERVSVDPSGDEVDKESWMPDISADGSYVVFSSLSDDLAAGDSNGKEDVFRRDMAAGVTIRVSLALGGSDPDEFSTGPALASDAPAVAFTSKAQNLVPDDENDKTDVFTAPRD